jgi:hypothetical protein
MGKGPTFIGKFLLRLQLLAILPVQAACACLHDCPAV